MLNFRSLLTILISKRTLRSTPSVSLDFQSQSKERWTKRGREKDKKANEANRKAVVRQGYMFDELSPEDRNKESFETAIGMFLHKNVHLRGHCEFIYAALKRMKEFGVHEDLAVYKRLIAIFPKDKMVSKNIYQAEYYYYPKQQECCSMILEQLRYYEVHPDKEIHDLVIKRFGQWSHVSRKMKRIMYWAPRLRFANPYPHPQPLPRSDIELAKIAMERMCRDPGNTITVSFTGAIPDAVEDTWIVSGQSALQKSHINEHRTEEPLYVDGPYRVWVKDKSLLYFTLSAEPNREKHFEDTVTFPTHTEDEWANWQSKYNAEFPESRKQLMLAPTIHEQSDGTILALSISGTNSKDSMAYWIGLLQKDNPKLSKIPVVFRIQHTPGEVVTLDDAVRYKCTTNMMADNAI